MKIIKSVLIRLARIIVAPFLILTMVACGLSVLVNIPIWLITGKGIMTAMGHFAWMHMSFVSDGKIK